MERTHHPRRHAFFYSFHLLLLNLYLSSTIAYSTPTASAVNISTTAEARVARQSTINHITIIEFGAVGAYVNLFVNGRFIRRSLPSTTSKITIMLPAASTMALRVFGHGTGALYVTVRGRGNLLSSSQPQLFHAIAQRAMPVSPVKWPTISYDAVACSWPLARSVSVRGVPLIPNTVPLWAGRAHASESVLVRNVARGCGSSDLSRTTTTTPSTTDEKTSTTGYGQHDETKDDNMKEVEFDMKAEPDRNAVALASGFVRRLRRVVYARDRIMGVRMIALTGVLSVQSRRRILLKSHLLKSQLLQRQVVNTAQRYESSSSSSSELTWTGVKTDCFAEKCGTEVEVMSEAELRKEIVITAVNKLRQRSSFDDVYDIEGAFVTKEVEQFIYAVFIPFRQMYIAEFRR